MKSESPRECYMRHIAHANNFILKEIVENIQKQQNNEKV